MPRHPKPTPKRRKHFLREWRLFRNVTQQQAMERLDWSQSKISRIENGQTPYNQDDLEAASFAYACSVYELLNVNPLKEGEVVDISGLLAGASEEQRKQILDFARYTLRKDEAS